MLSSEHSAHRPASGERAVRGADEGHDHTARTERRLQTLEARSEHLELEREGLQDAVHRRAVREDESIDELRSRTEPNQIARDLSRNARMRGL